MPYIKQELRVAIENDTAFSAGELNFQMTLLAEKYRALHGDCYDVFNDITGAFECAKQEFYRRVVVPYEDKKMKENGDVYATAQEAPQSHRPGVEL